MLNVDHVGEQVHLGSRAGDAVENQHVVVEVYLAGLDLLLDMVSEDANRQLVGHELALRCVGEELLADFRFLVEPTKDVAHGQVHEIGHLANNDALRSLSRSRPTEHEH